MAAPEPTPRVTRSRVATTPRRPAGLRLVGSGAVPGAAHAQAADLSATDPRWVLAVRVGEQLQGAVLTPERRDRLMKTGKVLGLTAFDCQLIIAIVQDQARRGYQPEQCPRAGAAQLGMIPLTKSRWLDKARVVRIAWCIVGIVAVELAVVWWMMG